MAKRKANGYGPRTAWYKIKNPTNSQAERRRELFERRAEVLRADRDRG